jgi:hypothetical protein
MVCHCKCCGRKRSKLLQRSPRKANFSARYGTYTVTLQELKAVIKARTLAVQTNIPKTTGQQTNKHDDFQEVRRQMTATRRSPSDKSKTINFPLFLITLPRTTKSQEIFRLLSLCHIAIRVEAYRAQNGLTQCHNCQQFGHVWVICKQPPRF